MEDREILIQEYNNLWNEKLIHKQSIRKFHNYLTYLTAIGSVALTFHGVSAQDFFKAGVDPATASYLVNNLSNIIHLFFIPLTPIVIITLTFPINDIFHVYAIGNQIGQVECKINSISCNPRLLVWEHSVCPAVYGGEKVENTDKSITNVISAGDYLLLFPTLIIICTFSTYISVTYLYLKLGCGFSMIYLAIIIYMLGAIVFLGLKLKNCTGPAALLTKVIQYKNLPLESERKC
jgi:hypothetical protein